MTQKVYQQPPIVEAIVEFQFNNADWDLTIPGKMQEHKKVNAIYSGKQVKQKFFEAKLKLDSNSPNADVSENLFRIQLPDQEGKKLISIGQNSLGISTLRPYDSWEYFRGRVSDALEAYLEIVKPSAISRVGVRYVNKIMIPDKQMAVNDYFMGGVRIPRQLPTLFNEHFSRTVLIYEDGAKLILSFANIETRNDSSTFILDLDVIRENIRDIDLTLDNALAIADDLHAREGLAFEASITDKTRGLFNGINDD